MSEAEAKDVLAELDARIAALDEDGASLDARARDRIKAQDDEIAALRRTLRNVREFLSKPEWGTFGYMEGSEIYADKDDAISAIDCALKDDNRRFISDEDIVRANNADTHSD